jgi:hypothetical protein
MVIPQREKSGIWNAGTREIHYRIEGGDPHQMFRVEPRQVGDFCFLILRVRNNERILNREFKEVYKIQVRAVVYADDEIINNGSAIASALVSGGSELVEEETTYSSTMTKSFENKLLLDTSKLLLLPSGSESLHKENEVGIDEDNDDDGLNTNKDLSFLPSFIVGDQSLVGKKREEEQSIISSGGGGVSGDSGSDLTDPFSRGGRTERESESTVSPKTNNNKGERGNGRKQKDGAGGGGGGGGKNRRNSSSLDDSSSFSSASSSLRRSLRDDRLRNNKESGSFSSSSDNSNGNCNNRTRTRRRGGERRRNPLNKEKQMQGIHESSGGGSVCRVTLISTTSATPTTTTSTTTSTTTRKPKVTTRNRILLMQAERIVFVRILDVDDNQVSEKKAFSLFVAR